MPRPDLRLIGRGKAKSSLLLSRRVFKPSQVSSTRQLGSMRCGSLRRQVPQFGSFTGAGGHRRLLPAKPAPRHRGCPHFHSSSAHPRREAFASHFLASIRADASSRAVVDPSSTPTRLERPISSAHPRRRAFASRFSALIRADASSRAVVDPSSAPLRPEKLFSGGHAIQRASKNARWTLIRAAVPPKL